MHRGPEDLLFVDILVDVGWKSSQGNFEAESHDRTICNFFEFWGWGTGLTETALLWQRVKGHLRELSCERQGEKKKKHGETLVSYKHFYFRCLNCTNGSVSQDPVLSHSAAWVSPYSLSCKKDTWPPRAESLSRTAIGHVASLRLSSGIWKKFSYLIWPHLLLSVTLEIKILSHSYPR